MKRAWATPASVAARTTTRPSGRCQAVAVEPSASGPSQVPLRHIRRRRYGPVGVTTSSIIVLDGICSGRSAALPGTFARMKLVDAVSLRSRRRKLRLFLDELRPTAATTVLDVGADEVGFGSRRRPVGLRHAQLLRGALSVARPDHGARAARRRRLPQPLPRDRLRVGRRVRAPVPRPGVRRRLLERGDRARRRRRAAAPVRRRGAARRPAGVPDDPEPLVPDRGAHAAAARPLAAEGGLRSRLRPRPARAGRARTTCSAAATSAASSPARCGSSTSASRSSRSHERAPAPDRARRPDRRARGCTTS